MKIKQIIKRKQYENIKGYIEFKIAQAECLRDNIEIPDEHSPHYFTSVKLKECHIANVICLKEILRFIELEETI